jgi:hypothetical protein
MARLAQQAAAIEAPPPVEDRFFQALITNTFSGQGRPIAQQIKRHRPDSAGRTWSIGV